MASNITCRDSNAMPLHCLAPTASLGRNARNQAVAATELGETPAGHAEETVTCKALGVVEAVDNHVLFLDSAGWDGGRQRSALVGRRPCCPA